MLVHVTVVCLEWKLDIFEVSITAKLFQLKPLLNLLC